MRFTFITLLVSLNMLSCIEVADHNKQVKDVKIHKSGATSDKVVSTASAEKVTPIHKSYILKEGIYVNLFSEKTGSRIEIGSKKVQSSTTIEDIFVSKSGTIYCIKAYSNNPSCLHRYQDSKWELVHPKELKGFADSDSDLIYAFIDLPKHKSILHSFDLATNKWQIALPNSCSKAMIDESGNILAIRKGPQAEELLGHYKNGQWNNYPGNNFKDIAINNGTVYSIRSGKNFDSALFKLESGKWKLISIKGGLPLQFVRNTQSGVEVIMTNNKIVKI